MGKSHSRVFASISLFPFFSTQQMFHTSVSLLTKAAFFCWGRSVWKENLLLALVPNSPALRSFCASD